MNSFSILILDDEESWIARHERRLMKAGFNCQTTQSAAEAIKIIKTDPTIKFAVIDEILYVPPVSPDENERELQRWQGQGVIREITALRSDIRIIVVSAAPQLESNGNNKVFRQETSKLRRQKGVIDIIHKVDIQEDPEDSYTWLINLISQPRDSTKANVVTPRVLVGWGFTKNEYEAMLEITRRQSRFLPLAQFVEFTSKSVIDDFCEKAKEKKVLYEMIGSKRPSQIKTIKSNSRSFQILEFLALQTEIGENVEIGVQDYKYKSRKPSRRSDKSSKINQSDLDKRILDDFMYEYDTGGRKHLKVQVEKDAGYQCSPLKVAIHRLSKQLGESNIGPSKHLFDHNNSSYSPRFELRIVLYAIKTKKTKKR